MNRATSVVTVALLASTLGVGTLFTVQNSARVTQLSLDLHLAAWQLREPVAVPALMGVCFGAGFLSAAVLFGFQALRASRKARRLQQELALASAGAAPASGPPSGWRS